MDNYVLAHGSAFVGEWVALDRGIVVSHNKNVQVVFDEARMTVRGIPFIAYVPEYGVMLF